MIDPGEVNDHVRFAIWKTKSVEEARRISMKNPMCLLNFGNEATVAASSEDGEAGDEGGMGEASKGDGTVDTAGGVQAPESQPGPDEKKEMDEIEGGEAGEAEGVK